MKENNILHVLMYLLKHYIQNDCKIEIEESRLLSDLENQGFEQETVEHALRWIHNLSTKCQNIHFTPPGEKSIRIYHDKEHSFLNFDCRRFLIMLEQEGVLTPHARELVINQASELDVTDVDLSILKWIILMVLFNQSNNKSALTSMEFLIFDNTSGNIH